ncbi:hypothetical protein JXM83_06205 [Candidatus Woesearchaeota archaeon]|nr:hypothetical protein [Candidatus Woesearchaeota archaeon]
MDAKLEVIKARINSFDEIIAADYERAEALLESLGELGGMYEEGHSKLEYSDLVFDNISKINFDKHGFFGSINGLHSRIERLYDSLDDREPLAQSLMPVLQNFMKEMRFLDMFGDTKSMLDEAQGLYLKITLQVKTFRKNDFPKLWNDFFNLLGSVDKIKDKIDYLNNSFMTISKGAATLESQSSLMVTMKELSERKKDIFSRFLALNSKIEQLSKKLVDIARLEDPNFLFIGQSLHNYVSRMYELGFDSEYIISYLSKYGVQTDLVKMVVSRVVK